LILITDEGDEYPYCDFWTGYFEALHKAVIVITDENLKELIYEP